MKICECGSGEVTGVALSQAPMFRLLAEDFVAKLPQRSPKTHPMYAQLDRFDLQLFSARTFLAGQRAGKAVRG